MVRTFSSLSFHHSVFITHHPSSITHHSSLKISQFSLPCVWTLFSLQITQIFRHFLWDPQLITKSVIAVVYPRNNSQFLQFSFPLHPENKVPLPTQTRTLYSCVEAPSPRLVSVYHHHFRSSLASPRLASFSSSRFEQASPAGKTGMLCW